MKVFSVTCVAIIAGLVFSASSPAQFEAVKPKNSTSTPKTAAYGVVVKAAPKTFKDSFNGMTLQSNGGFSQGLTIVNIDDFGLGRRNGMDVGDVILEFNGKQVNTESDINTAFSSIPPTTVGIQVKVIDNKNGQGTIVVPYSLVTNGGVYQTNFGRLELIESPSTTTANATNMEGTLFFYDGAKATVKGTLSSGRMRGTTIHPTFGTANFDVSKNNQMFEGTVTQNSTQKFVIIKTN